MEIRPIISAMLRSKTGPLLIALQLAITLAIVVNAAFIIEQRAEKMQRPTGMDDRNIIFVNTYGFGADYNHRESIRQDLAALRAIPGVIAAGYLDAVPLSGGGSSTGYVQEPPAAGQSIGETANYYNADENTLDALGLKLESGRWFSAEEIAYRPGQNYMPESVIITRAFADRVFGDSEPAVDRILYDLVGGSSRVVGVIEHMQGAWVDWEGLDQVLMRGAIADGPTAGFAVRVQAGLVEQLMPEIEASLQAVSRNRVITRLRPLSEYMERSYARDSAMVQLLAGVSILLVAITGLGVVGLAAFNVNQRRKQIGTRRALGARRADVLRYFMLESALITAAGIAGGTVLAFAMSWWLGIQFSLPPLDWRYLPPAMLGLLIIGQLAVLGPARRASLISPAMATRSV